MPLNTHIQALIGNAEAGAYTLPQELTDAVDVVARLDAARLDAARNRNDKTKSLSWIQNTLEAEAHTAAIKGSPLDGFGAEMLEEERLIKERDYLLRVLSGAAASAEGDVFRLVNTKADQILSEHLRPALDEVIAEAARLAAVTPAQADAAIELGDKVAQAYIDFRKVSARYQLIRGGQQALTRARTHKPQGVAFHEFRNAGDIGLVQAVIEGRNWRLLPEDPVERLHAIVTGEPEPWMPTLQEQDEAWRAGSSEAAAARSEEARRINEAARL